MSDLDGEDSFNNVLDRLESKIEQCTRKDNEINGLKTDLAMARNELKEARQRADNLSGKTSGWARADDAVAKLYDEIGRALQIMKSTNLDAMSDHAANLERAMTELKKHVDPIPF